MADITVDNFNEEIMFKLKDAGFGIERVTEISGEKKKIYYIGYIPAGDVVICLSSKKSKTKKKKADNIYFATDISVHGCDCEIIEKLEKAGFECYVHDLNSLLEPIYVVKIINKNITINLYTVNQNKEEKHGKMEF